MPERHGGAEPRPRARPSASHRPFVINGGRVEGSPPRCPEPRAEDPPDRVAASGKGRQGRDQPSAFVAPAIMT